MSARRCRYLAFIVRLTMTFVFNSATTRASLCTRLRTGSSGSRLEAANSASKYVLRFLWTSGCIWDLRWLKGSPGGGRSMLRIILSRSRMIEVLSEEDRGESLGGRDFRWAKDERDKDVALDAGVDEVAPVPVPVPVPVPEIRSNMMLDRDAGAASLDKLLEDLPVGTAGGSDESGQRRFEEESSGPVAAVGFFPTSMVATSCRSLSRATLQIWWC